MSVTKLQREKKRQMGQFMTPISLASKIVAQLALTKETRVLEPSMGDGSFIIPLMERFLSLYQGSLESRLAKVLTENIWGIELDEHFYQECLNRISDRWGSLPKKHNLVRKDFFRSILPAHFDIVVGNPPFGGSFDPEIEDGLDGMFGFRNGEKIKKETYAFFIMKSIDVLKRGGDLSFICSDTFLTINTMRGLRSHLMRNGDIKIERLLGFSEETSHPMVILHYHHRGTPGMVSVDASMLSQESIKKTDNLSFGLKAEFEKYFAGPLMGDFFVATSGMTTGKNEYFVRKIQNGKIEEPYMFSFQKDVVRLADEMKRARLGKLSARLIQEIREQERRGVKRRVVRIEALKRPKIISLPDSSYRSYNKAVNSIIYCAPTHVIYWENDGEAVITYKKSGNWYLRGVGGQPYFFREGLTWQLIASRMHMRYLPSGYVLDSGAPCAFTREGVSKDELYFALGWTLTKECNRILKEVINHTKNIQSKDFERLPYPFWVSSPGKKQIIQFVKTLLARAKTGERFTYESSEFVKLEELFSFREQNVLSPLVKEKSSALSLF